MMTIERQRFWARVILLVFAAAGLTWLVCMDKQAKISTDVLDLVPESKRQPELALVRSLASDRQARVLLFAVDLKGVATAELPARGEAASRIFAAHLKQSGVFEEVVAMGDPAIQNGLAKGLYDRRLDLLFPQWLERQLSAHAAAGEGKGPAGQWIAERAAGELEQYLSRPEAIAFQDLMPSDPLLLMPSLVDRLQGVSIPGSSTGAATLVWALQKEKPLQELGQKPVFEAIERARLALVEAEPAASLRWTGVARFAAESRARIEKELSWLNIVSLVLVAGIAALSLSKVIKALHLVPPILAGLLGAWVATTLCFERVHVLVFVVGSLLGGVAIDYGVYLYLQPPLYPGEPYTGKLGRLLKPLLASALTTVLGFSLLLASDLPLIRQLGVFVSAGLLCALAAAILWFAQLKSFHLPARAFICRRLPEGRTMRLVGRACFFLGIVLALGGPWFLKWRDNIRELEVPTPALRQNDAELRKLFGEEGGRIVYLSRGDTPAKAREAWSRFSTWQAAAQPASSLFSLALVVPSESEWLAISDRLRALGDFEAALRSALVRHGFDEAGFEPFFTQWRRWSGGPRLGYDGLVRSYVESLRGPSALLVSLSPGSCWYASVVSQATLLEAPAALDTLSVSQLESLNRLFSQYRVSAMKLSSIGLSLVGLSVFVLYGIRRGIRVFSIPVGACLCSFGLLGFTGQTLNLFHLLGAFLGVCLSHNYAIFSTENSLRGEGAPPSIRLSALTTAISFGVLSLSQIPVVAALGSSVSLIVMFALLIVELEPFMPGALPDAKATDLRHESAGKASNNKADHV